MIPFFGILQPRIGREKGSAEAPRKKRFFGSHGDEEEPASTAEQDALYLAGKHPEPGLREIARGLRHRQACP